MNINIYTRTTIFLLTLSLAACAVGPNYKRPSIGVAVPTQYKEANKNWKVAEPKDSCDRGSWWEVFNDPQLNTLEGQLNISNQNIAVAEAQYRQARAVVDQAIAAFFPTLTGAASFVRQQSPEPSSGGTGGTVTTGRIVNTYQLQLNAAWTPDIWGGTRRQVESNESAAQASAANVALLRLSSQSTLAQSYFQIRALDRDQKILDDTVVEYKKSLKLTQNRYNAGVAGQSDVVQAQSQLETAQALAINNGVSRAQFEHAIAVLIGQPASSFAITQQPLNALPPQIPIEVPSVLLERRPDIAQAERQMQTANALIGVAVAAYFPNLTLSASGGAQRDNVWQWLSLPSRVWSIGPSIADTIFDAGLRSATTAAARANYDANVATYRQTVLAAFQNVEDNLSSVRILNEQAIVQNQAAASARKALLIMTNQYKAGTVAYTDVITAQNAAYTAEKSAADVTGLRMVSAVSLIQALGGGWNAAALNKK